jgi:hypothetical protein
LLKTSKILYIRHYPGVFLSLSHSVIATICRLAEATETCFHRVQFRGAWVAECRVGRQRRGCAWSVHEFFHPIFSSVLLFFIFPTYFSLANCYCDSSSSTISLCFLFSLFSVFSVAFSFFIYFIPFSVFSFYFLSFFCIPFYVFPSIDLFLLKLFLFHTLSLSFFFLFLHDI